MGDLLIFWFLHYQRRGGGGMAPGNGAQNWVMLISEQHRFASCWLLWWGEAWGGGAGRGGEGGAGLRWSGLGAQLSKQHLVFYPVTLVIHLKWYVQLNMFRFSLLYGIAILYRVEVEKLYCLIQNYSRRLKWSINVFHQVSGCFIQVRHYSSFG